MTMNDADMTLGQPQQTTMRKGSLSPLPPVGHTASAASAAQTQQKPQVWFVRALRFCLRMLKAKPRAAQTQMPRAAVAERNAVSLAAQMPPAMAFKGDTTNTLATPMGAYAGKPVEQAMRRRAEEQFKNMDISQATMN